MQCILNTKTKTTKKKKKEFSKKSQNDKDNKSIYRWYKNGIEEYKKIKLLRFVTPRKLGLHQVAVMLPNLETKQLFYLTNSYKVMNANVAKVEYQLQWFLNQAQANLQIIGLTTNTNNTLLKA